MSLYRPNSYPVCQKCVHQNVDITEPPCVDCQRAFRNRREKPNFKPKPKTNADRIRGKSDYDLADWIAQILTYHGTYSRRPPTIDDNDCPHECPLYKCCNDQPSDNIEDWLKSPVEVDE